MSLGTNHLARPLHGSWLRFGVLQAHGEYEKRLREQRGARETKQRELSNLVRPLMMWSMQTA